MHPTKGAVLVCPAASPSGCMGVEPTERATRPHVTLDTGAIPWFPTLRGGQAYGGHVGPPRPVQLSLGQRDGR